MSIHLILAMLIGALAGYGFYRFVGCRSGACPIWTNPIYASLYGATLGFLVANAVK